MNKEEKKTIIIKNQIHPKDTGSDPVQAAVLKLEITKLSHHLKKNMKDIVSRRILLKKVAKEKKINKRLQKENN